MLIKNGVKIFYSGLQHNNFKEKYFALYYVWFLSLLFYARNIFLLLKEVFFFNTLKKLEFLKLFSELKL